MTAVSDETGRGWLPLKYEDGPDFCTVTFATGAAFALTVHPERMKLMEAALSAAPVAQEPVAYRYRSSIDPDWIYHDERLPPHDMAWQDEGLEEQGLYRSTPAGVGADGIARVFARWKKSKNLHESLAAQSIEKELLALLSRGAGESK